MSSAQTVLRGAFANGCAAGRDQLWKSCSCTRASNGEPQGISVDLATELARQLSFPLECVKYDAAEKAVTRVATGEADVGFFAIDPVRGKNIVGLAAIAVLRFHWPAGGRKFITARMTVARPAISTSTIPGKPSHKRRHQSPIRTIWRRRLRVTREVFQMFSLDCKQAQESSPHIPMSP
ncbi:transporter substrate-binding domain-containing protein [Paraburkholderia sp. SIMBA_055]